jgi:hypothetical protein
MTAKTYSVGDEVAWSDMPEMAAGQGPSGDIVVRQNDMCRYFAFPAKGLEHLGPLELSPSQWSAGNPSVKLTIVALNVQSGMSLIHDVVHYRKR